MAEIRERDLFTVKKSKPHQNFGKNKKKDTEDKDKTNSHTFFDEDDTVPVHLEPLSYETLMPGLVTLGRICNVSKYDLTVSLPFMMFGKVSITRISQAYTSLLKKVTKSEDSNEDEVFTLQSLFKRGQYVITKVESVEKEEIIHKVHLSLLPHEVNFGASALKLRVGAIIQCAVASVEDNGYAMETGIASVKVAFLNRGKSEGAGIVGVGSVVQCVVMQKKMSEDRESVQLKLNAIPENVNSACIDVTHTDDLSMLLPGTCFSSTVISVENQCLKLITAKNDSVVSAYHLKSTLELPNVYEEGQKIKARVLYITPVSRVIHLTFQKIVFNESPDDVLHGINIGDRVQGYVHHVLKKGIFFKLGSCRAYCIRRYLTDEEEKEKAGTDDQVDFPMKSEHTLRVMSYHYFDETFVVSLQTSVLKEQILDYSAIKAGQVLKATIKSYDAKGARVTVSSNVEGEIPLMHLTDTAVKYPEKKYAVGNPVIVRVLQVRPENKHLVLTSKKLLVNSKDPIVCDYNKELQNVITRGFIAQIKPMGLLVAFYNGAKGFVPKSETSTEPLDDLSNHFTIGNVVKCKIILVKPEEQRITLSLNLYDEKSSKKIDHAKSSEVAMPRQHNEKSKNVDKVKASKVKKPKQEIEESEEKDQAETSKVIKPKHGLGIGSFVKCSVSRVEKDTIKVRIKPRNMKAEIPICHLSDYQSMCKELKSILSPGDHIINALIFQKSGGVTLSMKRSLCIWKDKMEQFKEHCSYPAVVSEVLPDAVVVSILVGDACQSIHVDLKDLKEPSTVNLSVGESILVSCNSFDNQNEPILSFRNTIEATKWKPDHQALYDHVKYQIVLQQHLVREGLVSKEFGEIQMGNKLEMDVVAVTPLGLLLKHDDYDMCGIVMREHLQPDAKYERGIRIPVCVLHVHIKEKCLVLTAKEDLLDKLRVQKFFKFRVGQHLSAEVLLIQKDFILVTVTKRYPGLMAYMIPKGNLIVGQIVHVILTYFAHDLVIVATQQVSNMALDPVSSIVPSISVRVTDDNIKKEYVGVKLDEKVALQKIKNVDHPDEALTKKVVKKQALTKKTVKKKALLSDKTTKKKKKVDIKDSENSMDCSEKKVSKKRKGISGDESSLNKKSKKPKSVGKNVDNDSGVDECMDLDEMAKLSKSSKPCLKLSTGFVWNVPVSGDKDDEESSDNEEDEDETKKKKMKKLSKVERELLAKEEEKRLHELESARLLKERLPQTALDYEELLQESPNSSAIWIQFISFHLENAEVDRARAVAQRALQVISVQEFEERINVWTVMLRLEVLYGTEESTDAVFGEALATNDPLKIYLAMAMVYAESNKIKEAEGIYFKMSKKFSQTFDVWIKAGIFCFRINKLEEGRKYMDRALISLDKTQHVNLINRFAQLEFQFGEVERARTMFETLLSNYPKRMDMWIVYVDLLVKKGDIEGARQVLERMTSLKLRLRQMRSVFKKFLEFEKIHGTSQSVESVKNSVQDYVAASLQQD